MALSFTYPCTAISSPMLSVIFVSLACSSLLWALPLISQIQEKDSRDPIVRFSFELENDRQEGASIVPFITLMNWCLLNSGNRDLVLCAVSHSICELAREFDDTSSGELRSDIYADFIETSAEFSLFSGEALLDNARENRYYEKKGPSLFKKWSEAFLGVQSVKDWALFYFQVQDSLRGLNVDLSEMNGFELACQITKDSLPFDYSALMEVKEKRVREFFVCALIKRIANFFYRLFYSQRI